MVFPLMVGFMDAYCEEEQEAPITHICLQCTEILNMALRVGFSYELSTANIDMLRENIVMFKQYAIIFLPYITNLE